MSKVFQSVLLGVCGSVLSCSVLAAPTNFSYSSIGIAFGKQTLDDPIVFFGERYEEMGIGGIGLSVQFADDVLFLETGSQAASNEGPNTSLTSSVAFIGLGAVQAVSDSVDVYGKLDLLSGTSEACLGAICAKDDDTGSAFGLGLKAWFDDARTIAGRLSYSSSKYSKDTKRSSSTSFGLSAYVSEKHELGFGFSNGESSRVTSFSYDYYFK